MKNIFESGETMALYAQIDCCYYLINEAHEQLSRPRTFIEQQIDIATGYDKHRITETRKNIIDLIKQVISCKKKIGAENNVDKKMLTELLKLTNPNINHDRRK